MKVVCICHHCLLTECFNVWTYDALIFFSKWRLRLGRRKPSRTTFCETMPCKLDGQHAKRCPHRGRIGCRIADNSCIDDNWRQFSEIITPVQSLQHITITTGSCCCFSSSSPPLPHSPCPLPVPLPHCDSYSYSVYLSLSFNLFHSYLDPYSNSYSYSYSYSKSYSLSYS